MEYARINGQNRRRINEFIAGRWFSTDMIVRGERIDLSRADGIAAFENGRILGVLTYIIRGETCEITSLDSLAEGRGIGTALLWKAARAAKENGCKKVLAVTTNDNTDAMRFYQKRGFDLAGFRHNALDVSRKMKPEIPLTGNGGIPLKHELEFELMLDGFSPSDYGRDTAE